MSLFRSAITRNSLLRNVSAVPFTAQRVATIHTTRLNRIGPAGPQVIHGTVNDPVQFPTANKAHGSYHWAFERALSVALIPLTIAPFAAGSLNPITDATLAFVLVLHSHIGFGACIEDYVPHRKYGRFATFTNFLLYAATGATIVGIYEFQTNDVGLTEAVKRIWTAKGSKSESVLNKIEDKLGV